MQNRKQTEWSLAYDVEIARLIEKEDGLWFEGVIDAPDYDDDGDGDTQRGPGSWTATILGHIHERSRLIDRVEWPARDAPPLLLSHAEWEFRRAARAWLKDTPWERAA